jgi:hypothetical protein
MVISLVTVGSVIVTVNAKLLGGRVSFFQSLVSILRFDMELQLG